MFSGIVQSLGTIISISEAGEIVTLEVQATEDFTKDLKVGDSVAVDGVCLTLIKSESDRMFFDAVPETLSKTLIKSYTKGTKVNLEPSLKLMILLVVILCLGIFIQQGMLIRWRFMGMQRILLLMQEQIGVNSFLKKAI